MTDRAALPEISEERMAFLPEAARGMTTEHLSMMMAHVTHDHFRDVISEFFMELADALTQLREEDAAP